MLDLSEIKNKKLKELIEESYTFFCLTKEEQSKILTKIVNSSPEKQEMAYIPFFLKKNEEEDKMVTEREDKFAQLLGKLREADRYIKNLSLQEIENKEKENSEKEEAELLKQLNNL
jgi:hypothetical protein